MVKKKPHMGGVGADETSRPVNFFSQCDVNHLPPGHFVRVFSVIADVVGVLYPHGVAVHTQ
jgi:hypothetical protein